MPVHRGEVYLVNLNPVQGREQAGRRPVLVVSAATGKRLTEEGSSSKNAISFVVILILSTQAQSPGENVFAVGVRSIHLPSG